MKMTEPSEKSYWRTEFKVVVLSEDQAVDGDLDVLHEQITTGDCSGVVELIAAEELTPAQMALALIEQGSDPEFFNLTEKGEPSDEDEETDD